MPAQAAAEPPQAAAARVPGALEPARVAVERARVPAEPAQGPAVRAQEPAEPLRARAVRAQGLAEPPRAQAEPARVPLVRARVPRELPAKAAAAALERGRSAEELELGLDFAVLPMLTAFASTTRKFIEGTLAAAVLVLYTGCGDQGSERKGGGEIPDLTAGAGSGGAGGGAAETLVPWCDAYKIVNCVCQQCHQNPTRNGAAMPLMTYEDTQLRYPPSSSTFVWEKMEDAVTNRTMPETGDPSVEPPVSPLTEAQRTTLLAWLAQGAHAEGGLNCQASCDWSK